MTLGLAPPDARGRFFALKDIVTSCVNSGCTLVLGRLLDWQIDRGHALAGYAMIGLICWRCRRWMPACWPPRGKTPWRLPATCA